MKSDAASDLSCIIGRYKDFFMTSNSSVFGAYELGGVDPTGLGDTERRWCTAVLRSLLRNSPQNMALTQYYVHQTQSSVPFRERFDKRSNTLAKRRSQFLQDQRHLCTSRIFFLPELPFNADLNSFMSVEFVQHMLAYPFSKEAREYIKMRFCERESVLAYQDDLQQTADALDEEMNMHLSRLDLTSSQNAKLNAKSHWSLLKALHNFDFSCLDDAGSPPSNYINSRIFEGNISAVNIKGTDFLKISGLETVYVRFASIKGFSDGYIDEALFTKGVNSPVMVKGNYVFMTRYRGLDNTHKNRHFREIQDDVQRSQISPMDLISGNKKSALEHQLIMSDKDKAILKEVQEAMLLSDYHGRFEASVAVFGHDIQEINKTCKDLRASLNQASVDIVWESAGLEAAFECFLPGSQFTSKREMVLNSSKAAALSLYYKSSLGLIHWEYATQQGRHIEEAFYIFESNDGVPFHYLPHINGRCLVIGVGPVRSGKSFQKNTLATNLMKYENSMYTAIDIDPGTEMVAQFYEKDGGIFRLDQGFESGFNPFVTAQGPEDTRFKAHFIRQVEMMIRSNSNENMQRLSQMEQSQIDHALSATLDLPKNMQTFESFMNHCNDDIAHKLARFFGDGMYANVYDNGSDAIGSLNKRFSVYNLMGVKDDPVVLPLVMNEIVYRVLRTFENPSIRDSFKFLDIDEAHQFLAIPGMADFLVRGIRTWGKWNAGVSLWTQSPLELSRIADWPALKSAASTFWFMADGEMDRDLYRSVFELSEGHLDAIENLIPKQQAFIYQPDLRIAKVVNLFVEPEQKVINTSVAGEVSIRSLNLERFDDIDQAIQQTIQDLDFA